MTAQSEDRQVADHTAALCALLADERELRRLPEVSDAATHARSLVASRVGAEELRAAFRAVDDALRRAGEARGLLGRSRGVASGQAPGIGPQLRVAVCPAAVRCSRVERARDLLPAPPCAVSGDRMRKVRLRPGT
ncbi:hypothetical protein [Streptomyces sp. B6B3]|uniref:hypothetical protein n=1 Tax=Streptomyces sp. B6B3 TaxID=3153570 RepID=UPI00325D5B76